VSRLSPGEARGLFPPLHPELSAVHIEGGARVDGRLLAAALRRAAERRGARVHAGAAASGLLHSGGRVTGVRVGAEVITADAVVAGAWAPALLVPVEIALAVSPQRGQISHPRLEGVATGR
jgi:D-amino-acid dehydrogenase